jgi:putative ABC transport system permease protein
MLIVSLVIATCGLSTVLIINASAKQSYANTNTLLISNVGYQVVSKNPQVPLTKQDYVTLRQQGFNQLIAIAQSSTHIYQDNVKVSERRIVVTGIDTVSLLTLMNNNNADLDPDKPPTATNRPSQAPFLTSMPFSAPVGIVHPTLLKQLNTAEGKNRQRIASHTLSISNTPHTDQASTNKTYLPELVAFEDPSLGNDLITDIGEYFRLFPKGKLSSLLLVTEQTGESLQSLRDLIERKLPNHLMLMPLSSNNQQGELTDSFHMNLLAMALLMFVVCLFIVINAVNLLINARMPWFKICRQLGISRPNIFINQIIEISFITFVATCIGIFLSIHFANLVAPSVQATLEGLYGIQVGFGSSALLSLFLQVFGISICGSIAATIAPFNISNQSLNSIKTGANFEQNQSQWHRVFWICCLVFALVAFLILHFASALWLLLIATALLILSGCSLLLANYPQVINILYRRIPARFVMLRLSTKQSIALSGKTKVACCAFFIAATSNIGMNLMVDSFRGATVSWLESRLATDYYLYYEGEQNIKLLAAEADVDVYQRVENTLRYKGQILQQYSYPTTEQFKQAMVFYKIDDVDNAWKMFADQEAIFVNQQLAFAFDYTIGDIITLPHPSTQALRQYSIQGIIYDFGNPYKQVLLPLSSFDTAVSKSAIYSINTDEQGLARFKLALTNVNINYEQSLLNTQELLAISIDTFDRTFVITDGLNIVTLLVAALSLACAIVVLMNDVRPQNMLIRSLGVSAFKTQLLALFQYMLLCLIALIFATPFGILLSWVLIYDINLQAFQWTYPLQIDLSKIAYIYALSLTVVILVISIPIIRASKRPLIEDIRWLN